MAAGRSDPQITYRGLAATKISVRFFRARTFSAAFTRLARRDNRPAVLRLVGVASMICQAASAAFVWRGSKAVETA